MQFTRKVMLFWLEPGIILNCSSKLKIGINLEERKDAKMGGSVISMRNSFSFHFLLIIIFIFYLRLVSQDTIFIKRPLRHVLVS